MKGKSCKNKKAKPRGQAALEFAITMPFFILVIFGIFETSRLMYTKHMIDLAAREGARAGVIMVNAGDATTTAQNITNNLLAARNLNAVVSATIESVSGINAVKVVANYTYQPTRVFPAVTLTSIAVMRKEG